MCSRLVKLEARQWVAFGDERKGETHLRTPREAGWDWAGPMAPAVARVGGVPEHQRSVFSPLRRR